ncbi:S-methyl thiohydantoin desulfurase domain-containing protein [Klebsiella aerogenes]
MKRKLRTDDIQAAVWGGTILGGGGGGLPNRGDAAATLALSVGEVELWSPDEFGAEDLTATVALVGAPGAPDTHVKPAHLIRTIELLRSALPAGQNLVALNTNENGAETTVNGWFHASMTGHPVIDLACNGRAHPTGTMGSLGLHTEPHFRSYQAWAGGAAERYIEGVAQGKLEHVAGVVRRASVEAGGMVAVARNPVTVSYARQHGAPGAISLAIRVGQAWLESGVDGVLTHLKGREVACGTVIRYQCEQQGGLDLGFLELDDSGKTRLRFINEYMLIEQNNKPGASFPDLLMTFDGTGRPVVSAHVREGMDIRIIRVPADQLLLSRTMYMPELYRPLEALLKCKFAPVG